MLWHEYVFNIATIREITKLQIETTMRHCFTCVKILFMKMSKGNVCCEYKENVSLRYLTWKWKLVQVLWEKGWRLLEKKITYRSHKMQKSHCVFVSKKYFSQKSIHKGHLSKNKRMINKMHTQRHIRPWMCDNKDYV